MIKFNFPNYTILYVRYHVNAIFSEMQNCICYVFIFEAGLTDITYIIRLNFENTTNFMTFLALNK